MLYGFNPFKFAKFALGSSYDPYLWMFYSSLKRIYFLYESISHLHLLFVNCISQTVTSLLFPCLFYEQLCLIWHCYFRYIYFSLYFFNFCFIYSEAMMLGTYIVFLWVKWVFFTVEYLIVFCKRTG